MYAIVMLVLFLCSYRFSPLQEQALMAFKLVPNYFSKSKATAADLEYFNDELPSPQTLETELHNMWDEFIIFNLNYNVKCVSKSVYL